jgi:uncharacterized membrane protein YkvA (DUF1232 family)
MPLKIALELSDEDLAYYTQVLDSVWKKNSKRPEKEILASAREGLKRAHKAKAPEYVTARLADIGTLVDLLADTEWPVEGGDRRRILAAVGYFGLTKDMISDKIPGIGYLDDAIMAELVKRELKPDLEGYRNFCAYRDNEEAQRGKKVSREDWLAVKRKQIFERIRRRREQMWQHSKAKDPTHPLLRYDY